MNPQQVAIEQAWDSFRAALANQNAVLLINLTQGTLTMEEIGPRYRQGLDKAYLALQVALHAAAILPSKFPPEE